MKNFLIIIVCLFLIGCGEKKTRGLIMEINLEAMEPFVWRCQVDDQTFIKVTEEKLLLVVSKHFHQPNRELSSFSQHTIPF